MFWVLWFEFLERTDSSCSREEMQALQAWFFPFHLALRAVIHDGNPLGFFMWIRFYVSLQVWLFIFSVLRAVIQWKPVRLLFFHVEAMWGFFSAVRAVIHVEPCKASFFTHVKPCRLLLFTWKPGEASFDSLWSLVGFFYSCLQTI